MNLETHRLATGFGRYFIAGRRRRKAFYGASRKEVQERLAVAVKSRQDGLLPYLSVKLLRSTSTRGSTPHGRPYDLARGLGTSNTSGFMRFPKSVGLRLPGSRHKTFSAYTHPVFNWVPRPSRWRTYTPFCIARCPRPHAGVSSQEVSRRSSTRRDPRAAR